MKSNLSLSLCFLLLEPKVAIRKELSDPKLTIEEVAHEEVTESISNIVETIKENFVTVIANRDELNQKKIIELQSRKNEYESQVLELKNELLDMKAKVSDN